jgi:hypothetical protein
MCHFFVRMDSDLQFSVQGAWSMYGSSAFSFTSTYTVVYLFMVYLMINALKVCLIQISGNDINKSKLQYNKRN